MLRRAGVPNPRVLLIDTNSQAHATLVRTGTKADGLDDSLYTVLMADRQNAAQTLLNRIGQSTWESIPVWPLQLAKFVQQARSNNFNRHTITQDAV